MKPAVSLDDTRRVLADIAAVVRPVERARTAAAVERILRTASRGLYDPLSGRVPLADLYEELGLELCPPEYWCPPSCDHCNWPSHDVDDLPGLTYYLDAASVPIWESQLYSPWVVSPHLFGGGS